MQRSRTLSNPRSGFLLIDKAEGASSFDVIRQLRRVCSIRAIGHTGTLDPFATGLLICCLGSHTRLASFVEAEAKSYRAYCEFGYQTDTGDTEGKTIEVAEKPAALPEWDALRQAVLDITELPVPIYSAVKINGKKAYQYARAGEELVIPLKETRISAFEVHSLDADGIDYSCTVSKGTYIRSLSQWIARFCGSLGNTTSLRRTAIGNVAVEDALRLEDLSPEAWQDHLAPAPKILSSYTSLILDEESIALLASGRTISYEMQDSQDIMIYDHNGVLRTVANCTDSIIKPRINLVNV